jgi:hypothetical protein
MWVEAHKQWALAERSNRLEQIKKWQSENPGRTDYPPMNTSQRRAEEILLSAEEDKIISGLRFVCACGTYETDSEVNFRKHKKIRHQEVPAAAPQVLEAQPAFQVVGPPKRGRGRPKKIVPPTE